MKKMYAMLQEEIEEAKANLKHKQDNFDNAIPEFFDVANAELSIAINRLNVVLMKARLMVNECGVSSIGRASALQAEG